MGKPTLAELKADPKAKAIDHIVHCFEKTDENGRINVYWVADDGSVWDSYITCRDNNGIRATMPRVAPFTKVFSRIRQGAAEVVKILNSDAANALEVLLGVKLDKIRTFVNTLNQKDEATTIKAVVDQYGSDRMHEVMAAVDSGQSLADIAKVATGKK